jgi:ABC-type transporter Mla MlaB component
VSVLDLSDVNQVDQSGVRALADLWLERCTLVGCPRWLELWLARSRHQCGG